MREAAYDAEVVEKARLACLRSLKILDTESDERIDRVTRLAAEHFQVPIVLVAMVDADRLWFKSRIGMDVSETGRDKTFCSYTAKNRDPVIIPDALADEKFAQNPLVQGSPFIRFYAGCPLVIKSHAVGTLCISDRKPRDFSDADTAKLV
ncbi:MAG: GAF domain-containing protein, partial [Pseudomonadota bacterium]